jgi:hypothetical protein
MRTECGAPRPGRDDGTEVGLVAYPEATGRSAAYPEATGRSAAYPEATGRSAAYPEATGRSAAYPWRGRRQKSWAPALQPLNGKRGGHPATALPPHHKCGGGQARCRPMAPGWDGGPVVVRGRESRPHGEEAKQTSNNITAMTGARRKTPTIRGRSSKRRSPRYCVSSEAAQMGDRQSSPSVR